jgi:hypothetical protein
MKQFTIKICDQCLNLEGKMCNNPECIFCRQSMEDIKGFLDVLLIKPIEDPWDQDPPLDTLEKGN